MLSQTELFWKLWHSWRKTKCCQASVGNQKIRRITRCRQTFQSKTQSVRKVKTPPSVRTTIRKTQQQQQKNQGKICATRFSPVWFCLASPIWHCGVKPPPPLFKRDLSKKCGTNGDFYSVTDFKRTKTALTALQHAQIQNSLRGTLKLCSRNANPACRKTAQSFHKAVKTKKPPKNNLHKLFSRPDTHLLRSNPRVFSPRALIAQPGFPN